MLLRACNCDHARYSPPFPDLTGADAGLASRPLGCKSATELRGRATAGTVADVQQQCTTRPQEVRATSTATSTGVNIPRLEEYMRAEGIKDRAELARRMQVDKSTVTRLMNGQTGIGRAVYPGLRRAFPGRNVDLIFNN